MADRHPFMQSLSNIQGAYYYTIISWRPWLICPLLVMGGKTKACWIIIPCTTTFYNGFATSSVLKTDVTIHLLIEATSIEPSKVDW